MLWDLILVDVSSTWYWVVALVFFVVSFMFLSQSWSKKRSFVVSIFIAILWQLVVLLVLVMFLGLILMRDGSKNSSPRQNNSPNLPFGKNRLQMTL